MPRDSGAVVNVFRVRTPPRPVVVEQVDWNDVPVPALDPLQMLAGRVPGVAISSSGGLPDTPPSVILRGGAAQGGSPLFLIDGVVASGGLAGLEPADIERVEVLKGAAAAAAFGLRAGSGVINVITRHGRLQEGMSFGFRQELATGDLERDVAPARNTILLGDVTNQRYCVFSTTEPLCSTTIDWNAEVTRINNVPGDSVGTPARFTVDPAAAIPSRALANLYQSRPIAGASTSPLRRMLGSGIVSHSEAWVSGRTGNTRFYGSVSRLGRDAHDDLTGPGERWTARVTIDQRVLPLLRASVRGLLGRASSDDRFYLGNSFFALSQLPAQSNPLGLDSLGRAYGRVNLMLSGYPGDNPAFFIDATRNASRTTRSNIGFGLRYTPWPWIEIAGDVTGDNVAFARDRQSDFRRLGAVSVSTSTNRASLHALATDFSATIRRALTRSLFSRTTFRLVTESVSEDGSVELIAGGPAASQTAAGNSKDFGILAGTNLALRRQFDLDVLIRRDKRSYGTYGQTRSTTTGRLALGWNVGESWRLPRAISDLRLHVARGTAGGEVNLPPLYQVGGLPGAAFQYPGSGTTSETEFGAAVDLFRRLGVAATWAASATHHGQLPGVVPSQTGFQTAWHDVARIESRSFELALNLPVSMGPVRWSWRVAYDHVTSKIARLDVAPFFYATGAFSGAGFFAREGERVGAVYGRAFVTDCSQLPANFQASCGDGQMFQRNDDGLIVWVGNSPAATAPLTWRDGIGHNLWGTLLPSGLAPWGVALNWGAPIIVRDTFCLTLPNPNCAGRQMLLGNGIPDSHLSVSTTARWHRLSVSAMLQATFGRKVWNLGRQLAYVGPLSPDADQNGRDVETAKPVGYYWRASPADGFAGYGGLYDVLAPNSWFMENADYAKLREVAVTWEAGRFVGLGDWSFSVVARNLYTFTRYTGYDPEVAVQGTYAGEPNAVDPSAFPTPRTLGINVSVRF